MEQFAERANQTFAGLLGDSLDDTLKLPNQWINTIDTDNEKKNKEKRSTVENDTLDSDDFKKPKALGLKRNKCLPDHLLNPKKWTRYDLSDVKLCSDATNAQSALSFLNDLKKMKHSSSNVSSSKG